MDIDVDEPPLVGNGDYVNFSQIGIGIDENARVLEPKKGYMPGLYYILCIGEILCSRYRVEHNLGHGLFAIVRMARDLQENYDVAIKTTRHGG